LAAFFGSDESVPFLWQLLPVAHAVNKNFGTRTTALQFSIKCL
jgi:hypothetical protein